MDIVKSKVLTTEMVDFINSKMAEGLSLEGLVLEQFNQKKATKRVSDKVASVEQELKNMGYILNNGKYELEKAEEDIPSEIPTKNDDNSNEIKESQSEEINKEETKNKRSYVSKKQKEKELEQQLKENPYTLLYPNQILNNIDYIARDISANKVKNVGVYNIEEVNQSFKKLQERFFYLPNYLLITVAVRYTESNLDNFVKSKWVDEFTKVYQTDKRNREFKLEQINPQIKKIEDELENFEGDSEKKKALEKELKRLNSEKKRKQSNIKMNEFVADTSMYSLKQKFPFLSQSDIVNMCVYAFSECAVDYLKEVGDYL